MKVIFMGTPDFAVGTLQALHAAGHNIVLAVTQPDRPKGRGKTLAASPVKETAKKLGIPVYQPERVRRSECVEYLRTFAPDVIVTAAFGQILPQDILDIPVYGCVNVHASLLPKYRGAAPIQWAVINGETVTGVTTMLMDAGLDTGDILLQEEITLDPKETGGSLFDRLSTVGAELCVKTLDALAAGDLVPRKQEEAQATKVGLIDKSLGRIDWNLPAKKIECLIRGLNPWPSAFTTLEGKTLKIWSAEVQEEGMSDAGAQNGGAQRENGKAVFRAKESGQKDSLLNKNRGSELLQGESEGDANAREIPMHGAFLPGTVIRVTKDALFVQTGEGVLVLREVQIAGKKRMDCGAFLRGCPVKEGTVLSGG